MTNITTSKAPTHEIFHVVGEGKGRWTKIGIGWEHNNSDGLNLVINYTPLVPGRIVVRKIKTQEDEE